VRRFSPTRRALHRRLCRCIAHVAFTAEFSLRVFNERFSPPALPTRYL
jgi:hypothetical protein